MRLVAALVLAFLAGSGGGHRYTDSAGWTLRYPPALQLEHSQARFRLDWSQVTVATFRPVDPLHVSVTRNSTYAHVSPPADAAGRFPPAGAALRIFRSEGGPPPNPDVPETHFPLRLSQLRPAQAFPGQIRPLETRIEANGLGYLVDVWIGPRATRSTRATIASVLRSLAFPALRPGHSTGHSFWVMDRPSAYPVGSFTRIRIGGAPYYLVHAPGGFYMLGWRWASLARGYKSRCDVVFEAASKMFRCPQLGATWDRIGRAIARPRGAAVADPLNLSYAKVGQDGHVLVTPGMALFAGRREARRYWPGWRR